MPPLPSPPLLLLCALLLFMHLERCKLSASVTVCKSGIFNLNTTKQRQPTNSSTHTHTSQTSHTTHTPHTPHTQSKLRAAQSKPSSAWSSSSINNIICLLIKTSSSASASLPHLLCVCVCVCTTFIADRRVQRRLQFCRRRLRRLRRIAVIINATKTKAHIDNIAVEGRRGKSAEWGR